MGQLGHGLPFLLCSFACAVSQPPHLAPPMASDRSKPASKATKATVKSSSQYDAPLSANFSSSLSVVDYDHEAYLQLVSGSGQGLGNAGSSGAGAGGLGKKTAPKTANQVCREVDIPVLYIPGLRRY